MMDGISRRLLIIDSSTKAESQLPDAQTRDRCAEFDRRILLEITHVKKYLTPKYVYFKPTEQQRLLNLLDGE
jgi:hypothetical protein